MKIRIADIPDIVIIFELLNEEKNVLTRSITEIAENLDNFVVAYEGQTILGCGSFEEYTPRMAEIRSVVVSKEYRDKGIGEKIIKTLLKRKKKKQEVFITTPTPEFFKKLGFGEKREERYILWYIK